MDQPQIIITEPDDDHSGGGTSDHEGQRRRKTGDSSDDHERRVWTNEEDEAIKDLVSRFGNKSWAVISDKIFSEFGISGRSGKQCRERWHNHLDPHINKSTWTPQEEEIMAQAHRELGNKWSEIAKRLPGRTDNHVKNHWYSFMRRNVRRVNKEVGKSVDGPIYLKDGLEAAAMGHIVIEGPVMHQTGTGKQHSTVATTSSSNVGYGNNGSHSVAASAAIATSTSGGGSGSGRGIRKLDSLSDVLALADNMADEKAAGDTKIGTTTTTSAVKPPRSRSSTSRKKKTLPADTATTTADAETANVSVPTTETIQAPLTLDGSKKKKARPRKSERDEAKKIAELEKYLKMAGEVAEEVMTQYEGQQGFGSSSGFPGSGGQAAEQPSEEEHAQLAKLIMNLHRVQENETNQGPEGGAIAALISLAQPNSPRRQAAMFLSDKNSLFRDKLKSKLQENGVDGQSFSQLIKQGHVAPVIVDNEFDAAYSNGIAVYENGVWSISGNDEAARKPKRRKSLEILHMPFPLPADESAGPGQNAEDAAGGSLIKRRKKVSLQINVPDVPTKNSRASRGRPPKQPPQQQQQMQTQHQLLYSSGGIASSSMGPPLTSSAESPWPLSRGGLYDNLGLGIDTPSSLIRDPLTSARGSYDFLNSLEGLATLSGSNLEGYDFDDFANKIYSPRAGDDIRGSSPHRWSVGSIDTSVFFADSASRPSSARNSAGASEFFSADSSTQKTVGLPKKRSMAALRTSGASEMSSESVLDDLQSPLHK